MQIAFRRLSRLTSIAIAFSTVLLGFSVQADIDPLTGHDRDPGLELAQNPDTKLSAWQQTHGPNYSRPEFSLLTSPPQARWFSSWDPPNVVANDVANYVAGSVSSGYVPTLVIYNMYKRDCGSASAGGAQPSDPPASTANQNTALANYDAYIKGVAAGIQTGLQFVKNGNEQVLVLLEPDSLALQSGDGDCVDFSPQYNDPKLAKSQLPKVVFDNAARMSHLHTAVTTLSGAACFSYEGRIPTSCPSYLSRVKVYLDAGHSAWYGGNLGTIADRLISAGIQDAAGVFSDVSNYQVLGDPNGSASSGELAYGRQLFAAIINKLKPTLGNYPGNGYGVYSCHGNPCSIPLKKQIIDVSRNGLGVNPPNAPQPNGWPSWCDYTEARVSKQMPTLYPNAITGTNWVDALLWVKPPGETDGCFGGGWTDSTVARGVPQSPAPGNTHGPSGADAAGAFDWASSCMLINGLDRDDYYPNGLDSTGNVKGTVAWCTQGMPSTTVAPPGPTGLHVAKQTATAWGDTQDSILLEWNPSKGACAYQIASRYGTSGNINVVAPLVSWTSANAARTTFLVTPKTVTDGNPKYFKRGTQIQYWIRARACEASAYSRYTTSVTVSVP